VKTHTDKETKIQFAFQREDETAAQFLKRVKAKPATS
jgi:hypothetical protein